MPARTFKRVATGCLPAGVPIALVVSRDVTWVLFDEALTLHEACEMSDLLVGRGEPLTDLGEASLPA